MFYNKMGLEGKNSDKMVDTIQSKLDTLGLNIPENLQVPPNAKTPPTWVRIRGDKAYISGHGPQNPDGSIAGPFGKVGSASQEISIEQAYQSAKLTGLSILGSLKRGIGTLDKVTAWLQGLCKVKLLFSCYNNRQMKLAIVEHVLIYNSFFYCMENSHQILLSYPLCIVSFFR